MAVEELLSVDGETGETEAAECCDATLVSEAEIEPLTADADVEEIGAESDCVAALVTETDIELLPVEDMVTEGDAEKLKELETLEVRDNDAVGVDELDTLPLEETDSDPVDVREKDTTQLKERDGVSEMVGELEQLLTVLLGVMLGDSDQASLCDGVLVAVGHTDNPTEEE